MAFTTTSVEFQLIKYYGTERIEDATVANAVGRLMDAAARMPRRVWGELSWSAHWADDWMTSCEWRRQDARVAHDHLLDTGNKMLQSLADYTRTDIQVATTVDLAAKGLTAYLQEPELANRSLGTYRPGGGYAYADTPPAGMYGPFLEPRGNPELKGIYEDRCPDEVDTLADFMADYGDLIRQIEVTLDDYGLPHARLYADYLEPARKAVPSVIDQHAEEVLKGANTWAELSGNLKQDNDQLVHVWTGDAGAAAGNHGKILADYLDRCEAEAKWLGQSGKTCAVALKYVRSGFAQIGYAEIEYLIGLYKEFNNWVSSASNFVMHLTGGAFGDGAGDLVQAVADVANAMGQVIADQAKLSSAVLRVEVTANGMPDLGTVEHEHQPPARSDAPGSDAWATPSTWSRSTKAEQR